MMKYILKEKTAEEIKSTYKNSYISEKLDLSGTYISMILHRKKPIARHMAYAFTKVIGTNLEVEDMFEETK